MNKTGSGKVCGLFRDQCIVNQNPKSMIQNPESVTKKFKSVTKETKI